MTRGERGGGGGGGGAGAGGTVEGGRRLATEKLWWQEASNAKCYVGWPEAVSGSSSAETKATRGTTTTAGQRAAIKNERHTMGCVGELNSLFYLSITVLEDSFVPCVGGSYLTNS